MLRKLSGCGLLAAVLLAFPSVGALALELPAIFGSHMVLQRDQPVRLWGRSVPPGSEVIVELASHRVAGLADASGHFAVELPAMAAGGPHELVVSCGAERRVFRDVLVGEVWLAGGQSNMQWEVKQSRDAQVELADADVPMLRLFQAPREVSAEPRFDGGGSWSVASSDSAATFSAIGFFYGRQLQRELGVPVGIISANRGATPIECWIDPSRLAADEATRPIMEDYEKAGRSPAYRAYLAELERFEKLKSGGSFIKWYEDPGDRGVELGYTRSDFDDRSWQTLPMPGHIERWKNEVDGVIWFRRVVEVPADWAGQPLQLQLARLNDYDVTYFNGEPVGQTDASTQFPAQASRDYTVPGQLVQPGKNLIAVRVFDKQGRGGMTGPTREMQLVRADGQGEPIRLSGPWRVRVEVPLDGLIAQGSEPTPPEPVYGPGHWRMPGGFYQGMILPLSPLSIRGVIWYQGEGNSREAQQYETSFPMLIADWRERFRNPQMPFYFVQLANYQVPDETLTRPVFAELREAQRKTSRRVPNVGMAVAIDLGVSDDIHPKDKQSVAQRLARLALSGTYGRVMPAATGPLPIAACREGSGVVVSFHEVAAGLRPRGEALEGFELAGPDGVFHAAVAELAGPDRIRLLADAVAAPMQARYAFANDPRHVLLENTEGLAASPFVLEVTGP